MKVNLKNKHSPCMMCYQKGVLFSPTSDHCLSCEYNIISKLLAKLMQEHNYCLCCKRRRSLGGGHWDCPTVDKTGFSCHNGERFELDWEAACKEYGIETV